MKELVAKKVVDEYVRSGMKLGLGSGTTSEYAVRYIGKLIKEKKLTDVIGVTTSTQTEMVCHEIGIPITTLNDPLIDGRLDIAIDGPDEVDRRLNLTKGGGGALTQEKIVDYSADLFIIIADQSKLVDELGLTFPIPLEVMQIARVPVIHALEKMNARVEVRKAVRKMGAVITDNGNIILDILFSSPIDPEKFEYVFNNIPGVVENGLFAVKKSRVFVAYDNGEVREYQGR
jgi:ribose 5-phosphate isomerase A